MDTETVLKGTNIPLGHRMKMDEALCDKIHNCVHTKPLCNAYKSMLRVESHCIWWCGTQKTLRPGTQWWKHSSRALGRPSRLGQFNVMCRSKIGSPKIIYSSG